MSIANKIFHIAIHDDIVRMKQCGHYRCQSLDTEGFIHCCYRQQLAGVVQRYYHGIDNLTLLEIDSDKLQHELICENTAGGSELFPHVYGPINTEAICDSVDFNLNSSARTALTS